ncbi:hypothetical protein DIPPA_28913 [Diplonema papillatum]|nr:hypothetical protein DIPPA_28913 [Diplonema papillatum]
MPEVCCAASASCPPNSSPTDSCSDGELAYAECAYSQTCCSRVLCRQNAPPPPPLCDGTRPTCFGSAECGAGLACLLDETNAGAAGCCVLDACRSTHCEANMLCGLDSSGKAVCHDKPDVCCSGIPVCPSGTTELAGVCAKEGLEAGTCTYLSACCTRIACQETQPDLTVCGGAERCTATGVAASCVEAGSLCIDDVSDDCNPTEGGSDCAGCCVVDGCRSTQCEGADLCFADAAGSPKCEARPPVCCAAAPVCPAGTLRVLSCSAADLASGECHILQACCSRVSCLALAVNLFCTRREPCSPGAKVSPCGPGDVCFDDPDDACDPASDAACPGCCALDTCQTAKCSAGYSCHLDERGNARCLADCASTCGAPVRHGWAGSDDGSNACNLCSCHDGSMTCTKEACPKATCPYCAGKSTCGGKLGACRSQGTVCKDDPSDKCDPMKGGKDCTGCCEMNPCFATDCKQGYTCTVNAAGWAECKQDCETTCGRRVGHGYDGPDDGPNECNRCTCDDGVFGSCTELQCDGGSCFKQPWWRQ